MDEPTPEQPRRPLVARAGLGLLKAIGSVLLFAVRNVWKAVRGVVGGLWRRVRGRRSSGPESDA